MRFIFCHHFEDSIHLGAQECIAGKLKGNPALDTFSRARKLQSIRNFGKFEHILLTFDAMTVSFYFILSCSNWLE